MAEKALERCAKPRRVVLPGGGRAAEWFRRHRPLLGFHVANAEASRGASGRPLESYPDMGRSPGTPPPPLVHGEGTRSTGVEGEFPTDRLGIKFGRKSTTERRDG